MKKAGILQKRLRWRNDIIKVVFSISIIIPMYNISIKRHPFLEPSNEIAATFKSALDVVDATGF